MAGLPRAWRKTLQLMDKLGAVVRRLGVVGEAANVRGAYLVATSPLARKECALAASSRRGGRRQKLSADPRRDPHSLKRT